MSERVEYNLGEPEGRAKWLKVMTRCKKCGKLPSFSENFVDLRDQVRALYKHHTGKKFRIIYYSRCCMHKVEWKPKALHALHLILEGKAT